MLADFEFVHSHRAIGHEIRSHRATKARPRPRRRRRSYAAETHLLAVILALVLVDVGIVMVWGGGRGEAPVRPRSVGPAVTLPVPVEQGVPVGGGSVPVERGGSSLAVEGVVPVPAGVVPTLSGRAGEPPLPA